MTKMIMKIGLLELCTDAITANEKQDSNNESPVPKLSAFVVFIDEQLSELNKRNRRIAEKRLSNVLFDMLMGGRYFNG